ncbi:uncharacterized protein Pyn_15835 [Prunus yedoensis var. nudiflora]|uniref:Uncharacterized protein n=1 Tax=Prunus yedoensis var. nudiflora TaxID=2094558 RepID=A0A314Z437_PRUYE|nr:uncharacterized protein Pyn_15835 [Prunus yedoensis var. nudiflora]
MVREAYAYGSTTAASNMEMSGGGGDGGVMSNMKPAWLEGLMAETFFGGVGSTRTAGRTRRTFSVCTVALVFAPTASILTVLTLSSSLLVFCVSLWKLLS